MHDSDIGSSIITKVPLWGRMLMVGAYTETKLHPRANKFQSKTYQANSPTTQEHNPSTKIQAAKSHTKSIDTLKLTAGHFIALQREEIQLHPPEHQRKLP